MKKLTKKQIKDIARIFTGSLTGIDYEDPWHEEEYESLLSYEDVGKIQASEKILKKDPAIIEVKDIVEYVINKKA